ncbi:MAG: 3-oxoacyl-[acyl-carrier-protein] reductase [Acidobacteriota bacterium]|nr:MAG: 3-oxoacyl-[acyl-carrier-protein] reductase [Acidobacteriota bacterium]
MFDLKDQVALVTGAARGIGRTIADSLAKSGATVVLADFADWDAELQIVGDRTYGVRLDVTDPEAVKGVIGQIVDQLGRLDILVNNAGITRDGLLMRMKEEDWRKVLSTNLDGVFYLTKEAVSRMMRQRYGRIINIASVVGQMGNPGQANYVASKSGVIGLTKAVAREVASRNITVNAVAPGYIATAMTEDLPDSAKQELQKMIPLGRIGTVEDIASGVLFLASKEAGYITGHVLNINGGMYM